MEDSKLVERVSDLPWVRSLRVRHSRSSRVGARDARPAPAPGKMAALDCPGPKNFWDCPALPCPTRKCPEFNCNPALPRGFYSQPRPAPPQPENFFFCPAPKQKRLPCASLFSTSFNVLNFHIALLLQETKHSLPCNSFSQMWILQVFQRTQSNFTD